MVFSSLTFLCLFLPAFLLIYYTLPRMRNVTLVIFSLVFYAFGEPIWIVALLFSGGIDYVHGIIIEKHFGKWQAKAALLSSLILNLGLLCIFKYSGFIVENINAIFRLTLPIPTLTLPLGISFYTFQTLSYSIDMYRGEIKCQHSLTAFLAYVAMFPQLVAGPIVRYADIEDELNHRKTTLAGFSDGITRFATGLGKKVLLANAAGRAVETMFYGNIRHTVLGSWLGIIFYAFQIYFDFSGYSDMAIGLGRMIGFTYKENFNYPYIAPTITDFWRRWHISLSTFFRDYVYIPLGGNRRLQTRNLIIVWFLTGLWHGASWNFILWGLYYAALLIIEKFIILRFVKRESICRIYTLPAVLIGWALFYFTDATELFAWFKAAFGSAPLYDFRVYSVFYSNIFLLIILTIAASPLPKRIATLAREKLPILEPILNVALMLAVFTMLVGQTYNPFLYFRF
ncbi:MAG: MBOAT family protein [Oscillospiraceae bacterium]|nr:MBOAT family protein [Oscillospiraceae bacterium]